MGVKIQRRKKKESCDFVTQLWMTTQMVHESLQLDLATSKYPWFRIKITLLLLESGLWRDTAVNDAAMFLLLLLS